jgi:hypothetical protein
VSSRGQCCSPALAVLSRWCRVRLCGFMSEERVQGLVGRLQTAEAGRETAVSTEPKAWLRSESNGQLLVWWVLHLTSNSLFQGAVD